MQVLVAGSRSPTCKMQVVVKIIPVPQVVVQEVVRQVPRVVAQEVVRQIPWIKALLKLSTGAMHKRLFWFLDPNQRVAPGRVVLS